VVLGEVHRVQAGLGALPSDGVDGIEDRVDDTAVGLVPQPWVGEGLAEIGFERSDLAVDELVDRRQHHLGL
jgi:hypothetical protein